jgi:ribosomal protein S18 acetylase RimI-like enzyme
MLTAELVKQAHQFNDAIFSHQYPYRVDQISKVYLEACLSMTELITRLGNRAEMLGLLEMWIRSIQNDKETFPLETDFDRDSLDDEYWELLSCTGVDYPRFVMPTGLCDTFSPELPYVTEPTSKSRIVNQSDATRYAELFDPVTMKTKPGTVFEALDFAQHSDFVPALFIASRPQETQYSGHLIYRPWPTKRGRAIDHISIVSMGVNRDERRQGYASQMCRFLARMYPNCRIHCKFPADNYAAIGFFISLGADIARGEYAEACFSLLDLFPVERDYRKKWQETHQKKKK